MSDLPPPILIPPETVLDWLSWSIQCHLQQYINIPCRHVYTPRGVLIEPIAASAPTALKELKLAPSERDLAKVREQD